MELVGAEAAASAARAFGISESGLHEPEPGKA